MAEGASSAYFRRTSLFWMLVISLSMAFFGWTVFQPEQVPYRKLGPIGAFIRYLVDDHYPWLYYGFWTSWVVHVGEALYSIRLCRVKGITDGWAQAQWLLQTFLFGVASLFLLQAYKPGQQKKRL